MRLAMFSLLLIVAPLSAHAGFSLEATPSANAATAPQMMPGQYPKALPVVRPPAPRPVAVGFGEEIPLVSALRSILPDGFQSELTAAVDPDTTVSWQGGKPWDVVLRDAVGPTGISVTIVDQRVVLSR